MIDIATLASLKGKVALITGAAGHLGRTMSHALAELGAELVLVDREQSQLENFSLEISSRWKVKALPLVCDLEVQDQRAKLIETVAARVGKLNILINNAAFVGTSDLGGWGVAFEKQSVETWRRAIEVNLTAVFELCQGFSTLLRADAGSIINISSIYGILGPDWRLYDGTSLGNPAAYAASKGGVAQLSRWLATTLAPDIRVNTISPGGIARGQPERFVKEYVERTPMRRMMREEDVIGAIMFLATSLSAYVTGQNIVIDGGWSAW